MVQLRTEEVMGLREGTFTTCLDQMHFSSLSFRASLSRPLDDCLGANPFIQSYGSL